MPVGARVARYASGPAWCDAAAKRPMPAPPRAAGRVATPHSAGFDDTAIEASPAGLRARHRAPRSRWGDGAAPPFGLTGHPDRDVSVRLDRPPPGSRGHRHADAGARAGRGPGACIGWPDRRIDAVGLDVLDPNAGDGAASGRRVAGGVAQGFGRNGGHRLPRPCRRRVPGRQAPDRVGAAPCRRAPGGSAESMGTCPRCRAQARGSGRGGRRRSARPWSVGAGRARPAHATHDPLVRAEACDVRDGRAPEPADGLRWCRHRHAAWGDRATGARDTCDPADATGPGWALEPGIGVDHEAGHRLAASRAGSRAWAVRRSFGIE